MRVISHPMRLDSAGAIVTIDDASDRACAEVAGHVISCYSGERPLAPAYGIHDAAGAGINADAIAAAIAACEPEVRATAIRVDSHGDGHIRVQVDVEWSQQ